jgi:CheY-like chemotaxis protein
MVSECLCARAGCLPCSTRHARSADSCVAIVDDDESMREPVWSLLQAAGLRARAFSSAEEFLSSGQQHEIACLITDIRMRGMSGHDLQAGLNAEQVKFPIIFITARGDPRMRMQACGVRAHYWEPSNDRKVTRVLINTGSSRSSVAAPPWNPCLGLVERLAPTDSTVLIQGETELIACAIHTLAPCFVPAIRRYQFRIQTMRLCARRMRTMRLLRLMRASSASRWLPYTRAKAMHLVSMVEP